MYDCSAVLGYNKEENERGETYDLQSHLQSLKTNEATALLPSGRLTTIEMNVKIRFVKQFTVTGKNNNCMIAMWYVDCTF